MIWTRKSFFFFGEHLIFFFGEHLNLDKKIVLVSVKSFFIFGDHQYLDTKTDSICLKTDQNLGQDRLMLFPASKTVHPLQIPGYAPEFTRRIGSIVATGAGRGDCDPLTTARAPPFRFTQNTFSEYHVTTRQQETIEKAIVTLKDNSRLKFSSFFAKLLATNCCT